MSSCSDIFPTIDFLLPSFQASLPAFPAMPTVPSSGKFPTMSIPSVEIAYSATGAQMALTTAMIAVLIEQLTKFIPAVPLPTIPGLPGVGLPELLAFNPAALLAGIPSTGLPGVPPLWPTINSPEWSSFEGLQHVTADFLLLLTDTVLTLIKAFLGFLDDKEIKFPAIPPLTVPAAALPTPLLPDMDVPEFTQTYTILANKVNASGGITKILIQYVDSLPLISVPVPSITDILGPIC